MIFKEIEIDGVYEIHLKPIIDNRGFFMRTYDEDLFKQFGIPFNWVQENHSKSLKRNTIRGLHFVLSPHTDGKLIRCVRGSVLDIFLDLRKDSVTLGKWHSTILSETTEKWLYLPKGFAHGFCTLEDNSELLYKHDTIFHAEYDSGIIWNDADLKIDWPCSNPVISEKDCKLMKYKEFLQLYGGL